MECFNPNSNIDFMGLRFWTASFSVMVVVFALVALCWKGLVWGLDFTGGLQIEARYESQQANLPDIRARLYAAGFHEAQVMNYGSSKNVLISIGPHHLQNQTTLAEQIIQLLPAAVMQRVDIVGPQVGKELATKGSLAVLIAMIAILIYVAFRFEFRLAVSAVVALIHDPILILGVFAFFGIEFDLKALAGLLAVIGYSINDTIVVFDRVRENFIKMRRATPLEIMNKAINQTLSRTIMTSLLTLCVVLALLIYGGATIFGFALALFIGIVIGTYSSIYVAGALAVVMGLNRQDFLPNAPKLVEDRP
ncbi:MAG: protein translocase subunit SecF [Gammaproteobacteria bacterium]|nr:protein translocase subunit SecF [Gammaproteobacteria bacterium]